MDKFNDIWKNKFNDGEMPIGDWNTPEDQVWDNILPHVVEKEENSAWIYWLLGLLLVSLIALGYFITVSQSEKVAATSLSEVDMVQSSKTLAVLDSQDQGNIQILTDLNSNGKRKELAINSTNDKIVDKNNSKEQLYKSKTSKVISIESSTFNTYNKQGRSASNGKEKLAFDNKKLVTKNQKSISNEQALVTAEKPTYLAPLENEFRPYVFRESEEALPSNVMVEVFKAPKRNKLSVGVNAGAMFWQHRINSTYQNDLAPFDFNFSNDLGWYTAVNAQVALNKFMAVYAGVQYEQVETMSGHNSTLSYNIADEMNSQSNDYTTNLATPYGASEASFRFERNQSIADESVELLVDFDSKHTIRNVSAPVGIKVFPIGNEKRLVPQIGIGLGTNYLIGISNSINSIDTHNDAIQYTMGQTEGSSKSVNQWHFDARIGVGLDYFITRNLQVSLNYNWSRGLNPIFEQNDYNTIIDRHFLSVGLSTSF